MTYASISTWLRTRLGVGRSWHSAARISVWFVVGAVVLSRLFAPAAPVHTDRDVVADEPPSSVRYVAPVDRNDIAGFLPPPASPDEFNLAWIGGSEVKLNAVSLPAEFAQRVGQVGDRPLVIDTYTMIAMRVLDTYRATLAAIDNDADAIVVALNPTFTTDEWSLRDWSNLDVSDPTMLLRDRRTASWFVALTSPGDLARAAGVNALPLLASSADVNDTQQDLFDRIDVLKPVNDAQLAAAEADGTAAPDPRLPADSTSFWLERDGAGGGDQVDTRIAGIVEGFGVGTGASDAVMDALVDAAGEAGIPVYLYSAALNPTFIDDPRFADTASEIERRWQRLADAHDQPNVVVRAEMLSRDFVGEVAYFDPIHVADAGPLADEMVDELCGQWFLLDEGLLCR